MLSGEELMNKMCGDAEKYRRMIRSREYVKASSHYALMEAIAYYAEATEDELAKLFGRDSTDKEGAGNAVQGLYNRRESAEIGFLALKQEKEENMRGNPTQIRSFSRYLPESTFLKK